MQIFITNFQPAIVLSLDAIQAFQADYAGSIPAIRIFQTHLKTLIFHHKLTDFIFILAGPFFNHIGANIFY